ncbi:hypothetical protein CIK70_17845 [Brachybacterium alimentarium]|nr:hypothetical protein CIK70_17845 [Brachybacterium alimentarium]
MVTSDDELRLVEPELPGIRRGTSRETFLDPCNGVGTSRAHLSLQASGLVPQMIGVRVIGQMMGRHADLLSRSPMSASTGERRQCQHAP